jgi:hypothetical protein
MRRVWIGGEHEFALPLGQLRALQKACDAGPEQILARVWGGNWLIDDLIEVIRLGLIGGGEVDAKEAGQMVTGLIEKHPILQFKPLVQDILVGALIGDPDDPVGESLGALNPSENGSSAKSTAVEP